MLSPLASVSHHAEPFAYTRPAGLYALRSEGVLSFRALLGQHPGGESTLYRRRFSRQWKIFQDLFFPDRCPGLVPGGGGSTPVILPGQSGAEVGSVIPVGGRLPFH